MLLYLQFSILCCESSNQYYVTGAFHIFQHGPDLSLYSFDPWKPHCEHVGEIRCLYVSDADSIAKIKRPAYMEDLLRGSSSIYFSARTKGSGAHETPIPEFIV